MAMTVAMQQTCNFVEESMIEMERLRRFIKHLSFINEQNNRSCNLSRAVIAEIVSFRIDNTATDCLPPSEDDEFIETVENRSETRILEEIDFLRDIVCNLTKRIMRRVKLHQIQRMKTFLNPIDQKQFEDIFMASSELNLPFDIHCLIAEYATGTIRKCVNPHRKEKELLILEGNQHKEWFPCDYPSDAVVCGRCFVKYVKQCDGCGLIVLSNVIHSVKMDGKWYCGRSLRCIFGFGGDYTRH